MKKIFIGALLATAALSVPAFAADPSTPLRNDLRSNEAGVKNADPLAKPVIEVTPAAPSSSSTTVTVESPSGASVTTGSSATITTSALICADTRLSAKEQEDCSLAMQKAASADEQLAIQKRYEARLTNTPLRNDLKSNDAGVKGAAQPTKPN